MLLKKIGIGLYKGFISDIDLNVLHKDWEGIEFDFYTLPIHEAIRKNRPKLLHDHHFLQEAPAIGFELVEVQTARKMGSIQFHFMRPGSELFSQNHIDLLAKHIVQRKRCKSGLV